MRFFLKITNLSVGILLIALLIISTGCVNKSTKIVLKGESKHWIGDFNTTITNETDEVGMYTLFYKNDNWQEVQNYKIDIDTGRVIIEETGLISKTIEVPVQRVKGAAVTKNEEQTITIHWSDKQGESYNETVTLETSN